MTVHVRTYLTTLLCYTHRHGPFDHSIGFFVPPTATFLSKIWQPLWCRPPQLKWIKVSFYLSFYLLLGWGRPPILISSWCDVSAISISHECYYIHELHAPSCIPWRWHLSSSAKNFLRQPSSGDTFLAPFRRRRWVTLKDADLRIISSTHAYSVNSFTLLMCQDVILKVFLNILHVTIRHCDSFVTSFVVVGWHEKLRVNG